MKKSLFLLIFFLLFNSSNLYSWLDEGFIPVWQDSKKGVLKNKNLKNYINMEFVYINPGAFVMGSPKDEMGRYKGETLHKVTISKAYYIQTREVSQGQWTKIMGKNPSRFKNCGKDCPVEMVSWNDVKTFIKKLNELDKNYLYRLPTEAEWEFAARGGSTKAIYTGNMKINGQNNSPELDKLAWYGGNSCVEYSNGFDCSKWEEKQYACFNCGTRPSGLKNPNSLNLYDMLGNVYEWCSDWYGNYNLSSPRDPKGPDFGSHKIIRGGSWSDYARSCRLAARYKGKPDAVSSGVGFRLVCQKK